MKITEDIFVNLDDLILDADLYLAHINDDLTKKETLKEHTRLCETYLVMLIREKRIDEVLNRFANLYLDDFGEQGRFMFLKMACNIITCHDLGKMNPRFQNVKMRNPIGDEEDFRNLETTHSPLSSVIYIEYFSLQIEDMEEMGQIGNIEADILFHFLFLNGYIIARHHGDLVAFNDYLNSFTIDEKRSCLGAIAIKTFTKKKFPFINCDSSVNEDDFTGAIMDCKKYLLENKAIEKNILLYTYEKLMYSLLIACDYYATSEFHTGCRMECFGNIDDISEFYNIYKETELYKRIKSYETGSKEYNINGINVLRTEIFLETERELLNCLDESLFYIEAPTGIGKSNVALNLSFRLLKEDSKLQKIFYVYPFNTLIEQNLDSINSIFGHDKSLLDKIIPMNSVNPIFQKQDSENGKESHESYDKSLLNHQFLNYPVILTTHVNLFNMMFGTDKEGVSAFYQLCNSVFVLDEIQSYRIEIWTEITMFLKTFAKLLNIKVIIMSATLPDLDYLTDDFYQGVSLVKDRAKYFNNPYFKNRVTPRFDLLSEENPEAKILVMICRNLKDNQTVLIEYINKNHAEDFYEKLKETDIPLSKIKLLTGDSCIYDRKRILNQVKAAEGTGIVLVSTQVIEAGVDLDMNVGYKNLSKMDSEEQFMGRVNRSCKKDNAEVFFFRLDDPCDIYKNDIRADKNLTIVKKEIQDLLLKKDSAKYYSIVLEYLKKYSCNPGQNGIRYFQSETLAPLDFKGIEEQMRLIEKDKYKISIFFARKLESDSGEILDGFDLWEQYSELLMEGEMKYPERRVLLSKIMSKMNHFIYEVYMKTLPTYNDRIGELLLIEDSDKFFEDGVFKRKKFTDAGDMFL